ncbi:hypothetical protein [Lacrimispora sp. 38-1]|uniref:hypothetical protein n=1 Tax=Lacrimispora sp. 38-1 TaxID=3125778 RepID=UPI003CE6E31C
MIFAGLVFVSLSVVFGCQQVRWLLAGETELSQKEERVSILFSNYLKGDAFLVFVLWGLKHFPVPYLYETAGILFLIATFLFLKSMVIILKN